MQMQTRVIAVPATHDTYVSMRLSYLRAGCVASQAAAAPAAPPPPPAGLSAADVKLLEEKGAPAPDALAKQKLGLLNFLHAAATPAPATSGPGALPGLLSRPSATAAPTAAAPTEKPDDAAAAEGGGGEGAGDAMEMEAAAVAAVPVALTPAQLLLPLLAASCDANEAVAR